MRGPTLTLHHQWDLHPTGWENSESKSSTKKPKAHPTGDKPLPLRHPGEHVQTFTPPTREHRLRDRGAGDLPGRTSDVQLVLWGGGGGGELLRQCTEVGVRRHTVGSATGKGENAPGRVREASFTWGSSPRILAGFLNKADKRTRGHPFWRLTHPSRGPEASAAGKKAPGAAFPASEAPAAAALGLPGSQGQGQGQGQLSAPGTGRGAAELAALPPLPPPARAPES